MDAKDCISKFEESYDESFYEVYQNIKNELSNGVNLNSKTFDTIAINKWDRETLRRVFETYKRDDISVYVKKTIITYLNKSIEIININSEKIESTIDETSKKELKKEIRESEKRISGIIETPLSLIKYQIITYFIDKTESLKLIFSTDLSTLINKKESDTLDSEKKECTILKSESEKKKVYTEIFYSSDDKNRLPNRIIFPPADKKTSKDKKTPKEKNNEDFLYEKFTLISGIDILSKNRNTDFANYRVRACAEMDLSDLYKVPELQIAYSILLNDIICYLNEKESIYVSLLNKSDYYESCEASQIIISVSYQFLFPKLIENYFFYEKEILTKSYILGVNSNDGMLKNMIKKYFDETDTASDREDTFKEYENYIGLDLEDEKHDYSGGNTSEENDDFPGNDDMPEPLYRDGNMIDEKPDDERDKYSNINRRCDLLSAIITDHNYPGTSAMFLKNNENNLTPVQRARRNQAIRKVVAFNRVFSSILHPSHKKTILDYFIQSDDVFFELFITEEDSKEKKIKLRKIIFENNFNFIYWIKLSRKYIQYSEIVKESIIDSLFINGDTFEQSYKNYLLKVQARHNDGREYHTESMDDLYKYTLDFLFMLSEMYFISLFFILECEELTKHKMSFLYNDKTDNNLSSDHIEKLKKTLLFKNKKEDILKQFAGPIHNITKNINDLNIYERFWDKIEHEVHNEQLPAKIYNYKNELIRFYNINSEKRFETTDCFILFRFLYLLNQKNIKDYTKGCSAFQIGFHQYKNDKGLSIYESCKTKYYKKLIEKILPVDADFENTDSDIDLIKE